MLFGELPINAHGVPSIIGDGDTPGAIVEQHRPASRRA
jgi:hypothetical protein